MTVSAHPIRRRAMLAMSLAMPALASTLLAAPLLAGCANEPPPAVFPAFDFSYLQKLRLNVANIEVENAWAPATVANATHVEALCPVQPVDALRQMAQQRLIPVGGSGHARFVIDDASLIQRPDQYVGQLQVHLDVATADGSKRGSVDASVSATRTYSDGSPEMAHGALYELLNKMMADMNVELEFKARKTLRDFLLGGVEKAGTAQPVETQDLPAPPKP